MTLNRIWLVMVLTLLPLLSIAQQRQLMEARVVNNDRSTSAISVRAVMLSLFKALFSRV